MPDILQQRGSAPASCPGLQSGQLHASISPAEGYGTVVADDATREAGEDRWQGRRPQVLGQLTEVVVPRDLLTATKPHSSAGRRHRQHAKTTGEVCLHQEKIQFPWRLTQSMITSSLEVIWEKSD